MHRYALFSAPLYTPVSTRAPVLVPRFLCVAVFLVRLSSFHFPLFYVRRLILFFHGRDFGIIWYKSRARGLVSRESKVVNLRGLLLRERKFSCCKFIGTLLTYEG